MYRRQLVWTGYGWQYVDVFIPVSTGIFTNGYYPYFAGNVFAPGQIWVGPQYAHRGAGRLYR